MSAPRNNAIQQILSKRFRILLTGDPEGVPPWLADVAASDQPGLYLPDEAPWIAHGDMATLVGGIRALLMQALHPGSLTGVMQHSRYKDEPLGRLSGTIRWLTMTTFASTAAVSGEADRVNTMHQRVKGTYKNSEGKTVPYRAADPDLLRWVHIAFMDSFLRCHQLYSTRALPGGADEYIRLWSQSVIPLGLTEVPMSEDELLAEIDRYRPELIVNDATREVISFIKNPPLPKTSLPAYHFLFKAALASLPREYQDMIGLGHPSLRIIQPITRNLLTLIRLAIGPETPIEEAAIERLHRAGVMKDGKIIRRPS
ncbi:oxygenase MpaB family protein [Roseibacillus persicicus]|uniref:oxygenase MpaB family protein n=1 Tax=Roseibacillus persicicus TaxID=454148 RepID=UPI00280D6A19|nr:oxygenase MpaB family protein [Roseibacillus persicicus]MDQ8190743.1 oxygenase MpaB family protein [Roseibacillus persicicus]